MQTMGDINEVVQDSIAQRLVDTRGEGAQISIALGSSLEFNPDLPLDRYDPDKKLDRIVIGDAKVIIEQLAESHGWNRPIRSSRWDRFNLRWIRADSPNRVLRFFHRDRPDPAKHASYTDYLTEYAKTKGLVILPIPVKTPQGVIPVKVYISDRDLWQAGFSDNSNGPRVPRGELMAGQRASLLPLTHGPGGTFQFIDGRVDQRFLDQVRMVQADFARHALDSFAGQESFTGGEFIKRRYKLQFSTYDRVRELFFLERWKGPKQLKKYQAINPALPAEILAPAVADVLRADGSYRVFDGGNEINPEQINVGNLERLTFQNNRPVEQRRAVLSALNAEFDEINRRNWPRSWWNAGSGQYALRNPHTPPWWKYFLRKVLQKITSGSNGSSHAHPVSYDVTASHFSGDPEAVHEARLGRTGEPLSWHIIVAGYGPKNERDAQVRGEVLDYVEAEIAGGKEPNALIYGNQPSKFTLPIHNDVSAVAYRMMEDLKSPATKFCVVVGTQDVKAVFEAFTGHFEAEIRQRGKTFIFLDDAGSLSRNIALALDDPRREGRMAVVSLGDVPFADIHNIAYHPWRHHTDYIFGTNARDMLLDFMGMNAHYVGDIEGVSYAFKEGNVYGIRKVVSELFDAMYANRKSVKSGPWKKGWIFTKILVRSILSLPNLAYLVGDVAVRTGRDWIYRSAGLGNPIRVSVNGELLEAVVTRALKWRVDFRATHMDPKPPVDIDGIRDYFVAQVMAVTCPYAYQEELDRFAREALQGEIRSRIPALDGTVARINGIYSQFYYEMLDRERLRPEGEKLGITTELLHSKGFDPDCLPFLESGEINPQWLQRTVPHEEIKQYERAWRAYDHRVEHAEGLLKDFWKWRETSIPSRAEDSLTYTDPRVENFVLRRINTNPELYRGLVLEWDFDRLEKRILKDAAKTFGESAPELGDIQQYFQRSIKGCEDTPLRRVLLGMKAVDVLRRPYYSYLSPAEFQLLYPQLVTAINQAREVVRGERWSRSIRAGGPLWDGRFLLRGFFDTAQTTADQIYVRRVGESPPSYRQRGRGPTAMAESYGRPPNLLPHSTNRPHSIQVGDRVLRADSAVWLPHDVAFFSNRLEILPSRLPHLIAAASGATSRADLTQIPGQRMTMERLLAWTNTSEGLDYLKNHHHRLADNFRNRLSEGGTGLSVGLASLLAFEHLADKWEIHQPHARFAMVAGASHLVGIGVGSVNEVFLNRVLGSPFQFVTTRAVHAGGEAALQYSFQARDGLGRALLDSLLRNYGLQGSVTQVAMNGTRGILSFFPRTSWHMGPGLMSAALIDRFFSERVMKGEGDSPWKKGVHLGSFFAPEIYRLAIGSRGPLVFRSAGARIASRAFAAGFMADMVYLGMDWWKHRHSSESTEVRHGIYQRANELNDAKNNNWFYKRWLDGAFEMAAPSLAAWWDSVEFDGLKVRPNEYQNEARRELQSLAKEAEHRARFAAAPALADPPTRRRDGVEITSEENQRFREVSMGRSGLFG
jgi:hypothetical protein